MSPSPTQDASGARGSSPVGMVARPLRWMLAAFLLGGCAIGPGAPATSGDHVLVIVVDGLRADYITPTLMPTLHRLGEEGVRAESHHPVYPTLTRVNAASLVTGAYPSDHGLMHNTVYIANLSDPVIPTADVERLIAAEAETGGRLLTTLTVGEWLDQHGRTLFVGSSGSTGSAYLLNHKLLGGGVWNARGFVAPAGMERRARAMPGGTGSPDLPYAEQNRWMTDRYVSIGLDDLHADLALLWITDPDGTAHQHAPGAPETVAALKRADDEIARMLEVLRQRGMLARTNIMITTDHGFSTHVGGFRIAELLAAQGITEGFRVIGGTQIYVDEGGEARTRLIVEALQAEPDVGPIFTRAATPGEPLGRIAGTLSHDLLGYDHPRAADILVSPAWSAEVNRYGYPGMSTLDGAAGHGTISPFELRTVMIATGPAFAPGRRSGVPTGNVDVAPTALHLLGIPPLPHARGRVLSELLLDGPLPDAVTVDRQVHTAREGRYTVRLERAVVAGTAYVQEADATR